MGLPGWTGYLIFLAVPLGLWAIGSLASKQHGVERVLGFLAGHDHRLSLARLQAFLWTLVIFGSYAAATAIHTKIVSGADADIARAVEQANKAEGRRVETDVAVSKAEIELKALEESRAKALTEVVEGEGLLAALQSQSGVTTEDLVKAKAPMATLRAALTSRTRAVTKAQAGVAEAKAAAEKAGIEARGAAQRERSFAWITVPAELLALAGIAIGSGVFASLIATNKATGPLATVRRLRASGDVRGLLDEKEYAAPKNTVVNVEGTHLTEVRSARLDNERVEIINAIVDGSELTLWIPDGLTPKRLMLDTPADKLCFELSGTSPNLKLLEKRVCYEFSDLFRDEATPEILDLMKFQMFGWTVVAVGIYVVLFLSSLNDSITSLPNVPASIVLLTGLSQLGYLSAKAIANPERKP